MPSVVTLPMDEFRSRREGLFAALSRSGAGPAALILGSGSPTSYSGSVDNRFRAHTDFSYVTGFGEPNAVAVLRPDREHRFTMFVQPRDPDREVWDGLRAGPEGAQSIYGADQAFDSTELPAKLAGLIEGCETIYFAPWRDEHLDRHVRGAMAKIRAGERNGKISPTTMIDPGSLLHEMRLIKSPAEIDMMREAAKISARAHIEAMRRCRPGLHEYQLQATLENVFADAGAAGPAYLTIVGSGANGCILHYIENRAQIRDGDLVLIDAGAEYGGYCADITRTFPASGSFVGAQRDLYETVRRAQQLAIEDVKPGISINEIHDRTVRRLVEGLISLGLLDAGSDVGEGGVDKAIEAKTFRKYYMHRTSHWLGADVHDVGGYCKNGKPRALEPGMVFTIEPGLYIPVDDARAPEELRGQAVRIEDDVVVTADGCEILTRDVPVDPAAVRDLVGGAAA